MFEQLFNSDKFLPIMCVCHIIISAAVVVSINWMWALYFIVLAGICAATYFVNDRFIPQEVRHAFKRKTTK